MSDRFVPVVIFPDSVMIFKNKYGEDSLHRLGTLSNVIDWINIQGFPPDAFHLCLTSDVAVMRANDYLNRYDIKGLPFAINADMISVPSVAIWS